MAVTVVKNTADRRVDTPAQSGKWYAEECDGDEGAPERAKRVMTAADQLWQRLAPYRTMWATCARNYGDAVGLQLGARGYRDAMPKPSGGASKLSLNLTKSVCDTYVALVTDDRPKVSFLTTDGDWGLQQKAKKLETFVDGVAYDQELPLKDELLESDVAKFGTAFEMYRENKAEKGPRIGIDRIRCWQVLIDEMELQTRRLRNLMVIEPCDRADLMDEFPKLADKIRMASGKVFDMTQGTANSTEMELVDLVPVVWSWHLSRTEESGDGRWCRVLGDVLLEGGEYDDGTFPVEQLYRLPPGEGYFGSSIADELRGIQLAVNTKTRLIDRSDHLVGAGHWLIPNEGKINTAAMDNQPGSMIRYSQGAKPEWVAVESVAPTVYQERDRLYQYAFEIFGLSPLAAQAQIPAGIKSGRAMRVYADVQQKRFKPAYAQYQGFYLRRAKQIIKLARRIGERDPSYEVKAAGKETMAAVKWADANLPDNCFTLKMYPTNALADDPAERIEQVQEIQGLPSDMKRLLDFPDLQAEASYENASYELVMKCATDILERDVYIGPEVYMDLRNAVKRMQLVVTKWKRDGVPDDKRRQILTWIQQAVELMDTPDFTKMWGPAPGAPPGAPPAPPGMPMMPGAPRAPAPMPPPPAPPMPVAA